jgi:hypothetical protein
MHASCRGEGRWEATGAGRGAGSGSGEGSWQTGSSAARRTTRQVTGPECGWCAPPPPLPSCCLPAMGKHAPMRSKPRPLPLKEEPPPPLPLPLLPLLRLCSSERECCVNEGSSPARVGVEVEGGGRRVRRGAARAQRSQPGGLWLASRRACAGAGGGVQRRGDAPWRRQVLPPALLC